MSRKTPYTLFTIPCMKHLILGVMCVASLYQPAYAASRANDISAFRLTEVSGDIAARYILDEYEQKNSGVPQSYQTRPTYEEEVSVVTRSYVYHPNFLNIDLSGGVLFVQQEYETNQGNTDSSDTLYNFATRFNFLRRKPYPLTLFYERNNPAATTSLAGRFLVENTNYGAIAALHEPLSPIALTLEVNRYTSEGSGSGTVIDNQVDKSILRAYKAYGNGNSIQVSQLLTEQNSRSGSSGLPIQETMMTTKTTDISAQNIFGPGQKLHLSQLFTYTDQTNERAQTISDEINDSRYNFDLRAQHSEKTRSFYQYSWLKNDRSALDTETQNASIGVGHETDAGLAVDVDIHAKREEQDANNYIRDVYGSRGSLSYSMKTDWGTLRMGAGVVYDETDQSSAQGLVSVYDESVILTGTTLVALLHDFVVTGTVTVENQTQTQTYVENLDYELITVGYTTEIQRLLGGNIPDGDTVLVSYSYQTGGTLRYTSQSYNYHIGMALFKYLDIYARYRDFNQEIKEGAPTIPLNSVDNTVVGARAEYPFLSGWLIGGQAEYEDNNETISPSTRNTYNTYVQTQLPRSTRLRLSIYKETVDNINSNEDSDISQYRFQLNSRPWLRTVLSLSIVEEEDTGGTTIRRRHSQNVALEWNLRKLKFSLHGEHIVDEQGTVEQERTLIRAQLRRRF
ncbi:MAG: hypothetical protein OQK73_13405 [Gammaproteobacteria bacterium]|nr:hypothetical protein [Gammaproteobacteria bacterium]